LEIENISRGFVKKCGCKPEIDTVFIGGGTPSLLSENDFKRLFDCINKNFKLHDNSEITVEANPATVSFDKLLFLKKLGVNRLSLGFQSLDNEVLKFLGRIHNEEDAVNAFEQAREAGFSNINVDLIFGMPFDDRNAFETTLKKVVALSPEHVSCYSLIVEEGTALFEMIEKGDVSYPDDVSDRVDYDFCRKLLYNEGFEQYEISNFAKKGYESRHNLKYWRQEEYFGVGLGSASFIKNRRYANCDDFAEYIEKSPCFSLREDFLLTEKELADEFLMLGFRTCNGPDFTTFIKKFGKTILNGYKDIFSKLCYENLIKIDYEGENIKRACLTEKGLDFANVVFEEFV
jgi:oxygen-independent coproporphyrinogen-3 oxidase